MIELNVTTRDGGQVRVEAEPGLSLMENLRNGGIEEIQALCGGSMSCATCHVYVAEEFYERLPPPSEAEVSMLDVSENRQANSRLSCQIEVSEALNGLGVTVAP